MGLSRPRSESQIPEQENGAVVGSSQDEAFAYADTTGQIAKPAAKQSLRSPLSDKSWPEAQAGNQAVRRSSQGPGRGHGRCLARSFKTGGAGPCDVCGRGGRGGGGDRFVQGHVASGEHAQLARELVHRATPRGELQIAVRTSSKLLASFCMIGS